MIDFRLLRHFSYFLAVADERHFGKAAKRLGMSQPPLSQQIQVLEKSLGVRLFERSRQGVTLSREGAAILAPVRRFMEHAQRLQQAVMDARSGRSDVVTIGAINSAMFDIMPRLDAHGKKALSAAFACGDGNAEQPTRSRPCRAARSTLRWRASTIRWHRSKFAPS